MLTIIHPMWEENSPSVHENIAEVSPGLGSELGVVRQGALQEGWAGHLQDQAFQLEPIVHEHSYLDKHSKNMWFQESLIDLYHQSEECTGI